METSEVMRAVDCRFYLLPMEDGSTAVTYLEGKQARLLTYALEPEVDDAGELLRGKIQDYAEFFPEEYRLKVSLFKEMSRALPQWAEVRDYDWLREILKMSIDGKLPNPFDALTEGEELLLKWLLFTVNDPKITIIPERCHQALLERSGELGPLPTLAFLLEHKEGWLEGESMIGFLSPSPEDIFPLLYLFPEAARGLNFAGSAGTALQQLAGRAFSLAGRTAPSYRVLIMMEYLLHPGIERVTNPSVNLSSYAESSTIYKIMETKNARPLALLFYKVPLKLKNYSLSEWLHPTLKLNCLLMFTLITLCLIGQSVIKEKLP